MLFTFILSVDTVFKLTKAGAVSVLTGLPFTVSGCVETPKIIFFTAGTITQVSDTTQAGVACSYQFAAPSPAKAVTACGSIGGDCTIDFLANEIDPFPVYSVNAWLTVLAAGRQNIGYKALAAQIDNVVVQLPPQALDTSLAAIGDTVLYQAKTGSNYLEISTAITALTVADPNKDFTLWTNKGTTPTARPNVAVSLQFGGTELAKDASDYSIVIKQGASTLITCPLTYCNFAVTFGEAVTVDVTHLANMLKTPYTTAVAANVLLEVVAKPAVYQITVSPTTDSGLCVVGAFTYKLEVMNGATLQKEITTKTDSGTDCKTVFNWDSNVQTLKSNTIQITTTPAGDPVKAKYIATVTLDDPALTPQDKDYTKTVTFAPKRKYSFVLKSGLATCTSNDFTFTLKIALADDSTEYTVPQGVFSGCEMLFTWTQNDRTMVGNKAKWEIKPVNLPYVNTYLTAAGIEAVIATDLPYDATVTAALKPATYDVTITSSAATCVDGDFTYALDVTLGGVKQSTIAGGVFAAPCGFKYSWASTTQTLVNNQLTYTVTPVAAAFKNLYKPLTSTNDPKQIVLATLAVPITATLETAKYSVKVSPNAAGCLKSEFQFELQLLDAASVLVNKFTEDPAAQTDCSRTFTWDSSTFPILVNYKLKYSVTPLAAEQKKMFAPTTKDVTYAGPAAIKDENVVDAADMTKSTFLITAVSDSAPVCAITATFKMTKDGADLPGTKVSDCKATFTLNYEKTTALKLLVTPGDVTKYISDTVNVDWTAFQEKSAGQYAFDYSQLAYAAYDITVAPSITCVANDFTFKVEIIKADLSVKQTLTSGVQTACSYKFSWTSQTQPVLIGETIKYYATPVLASFLTQYKETSGIAYTGLAAVASFAFNTPVVLLPMTYRVNAFSDPDYATKCTINAGFKLFKLDANTEVTYKTTSDCRVVYELDFDTSIKSFRLDVTPADGTKYIVESVPIAMNLFVLTGGVMQYEYTKLSSAKYDVTVTPQNACLVDDFVFSVQVLAVDGKVKKDFVQDIKQTTCSYQFVWTSETTPVLEGEKIQYTITPLADKMKFMYTTSAAVLTTGGKTIASYTYATTIKLTDMKYLVSVITAGATCVNEADVVLSYLDKDANKQLIPAVTPADKCNWLYNFGFIDYDFTLEVTPVKSFDKWIFTTEALKKASFALSADKATYEFRRTSLTAASYSATVRALAVCTAEKFSFSLTVGAVPITTTAAQTEVCSQTFTWTAEAAPVTAGTTFTYRITPAADSAFEPYTAVYSPVVTVLKNDSWVVPTPVLAVKFNPMGAIIGGVVGGVVLIVAIVAFFVIRAKGKNKNKGGKVEQIGSKKADKKKAYV